MRVSARHTIVMLPNDYKPSLQNAQPEVDLPLDLFGDPVPPKSSTAEPKLLTDIERHLRIACELIRCRSACVLDGNLLPVAQFSAVPGDLPSFRFAQYAAILFPAGLPNDLAVLPDVQLEGLIIAKGNRPATAAMIVCAPLATRAGQVVGHCLFAAVKASKLAAGQIDALRDLMLLASEELAELSAEANGIAGPLSRSENITPQLVAPTKRQASIVERSNSPAWLVDTPSGRILDVNRAALAAYGYNRSEFLALPSLHSLTCETRGSGIAPQMPSETSAVSWRCMHGAKNGRMFSVEMSAFPAELDGRPARLILARPVRSGAFGLISADAKDAALAQISEAVIAVDLNFRITYWNAAAERLYHWRAADVLGELLPEVIQPIWSNKREEHDASTALLTKGEWTGNNVHSTGTGEAVKVECMVTALKNELGEQVGFLCVNSDVSERTKEPATSAENEERFRSLFDFNPDAVVLLDENGNCQSANLACKMIFGKRPDEIVPHSFFGLIDPADRTGALAAFDRALHGEPVSFDFRGAAIDKRRLNLAAVALPVIIDAQIVGVTVVTRDVSERKRLQGMIAAENELLQWLAAKKPLNAIVERLISDVEQRYDWLRCTVIILRDGLSGIRKIYSSSPEELAPAIVRLENFETSSTAYRAMTQGVRASSMQLSEERVGKQQATVAGLLNCRAACSTPILSTPGAAIGAFTLYLPEEREPTAEELTLSDRIAALLRVAAEADGANLRLQLHDRAINSAVASVAILDPSQASCPIVYVNQAFKKVSGYGEREAVERGLALLYGPETDVAEIERIAAAIADEQEHTALLRLYAADGQPFWSSTSLSPVRDLEGWLTHYIAVFNDVTALVSANEQVSESEQKFRQLIENAGEIVLVLEQSGTIRYVSPAVERVLGHKPSDILGHDIFEYAHPEDLVAARTELLKLIGLPDGSSKILELRAQRRNETWCSMEVSAQNLLGMPGVRGVVVHARDLSERQQAKDRLDHLAFHDSLTDLPNRLQFNEHLTRVIGTARRRGSQAAILFLDLDRFKVINDTLGHSVGDQLLQHVASRLVLTAREGDTVARWGGDEFTVILADVGGQREAARAAQRIIESLSEPFIISGHELYITATVGISLFPAAGGDVETLVRHADTAMYRAKNVGQNHYQFYTPKMNAGASERLALESRLRRALEREEFTLHYQPQIDAQSGKMTSCEALVRWQHPELGLVPPKDFIPLAEETGLIVPIGDWIMRAACRQAKQWQEFGGDKLRVAVNLSARQFSQRDIHQMVTKVLRETGLEPTLLELEITESLLLSGEGRIIAAMRNLAALGISVSIDDFGVGYSSYSYLKRYPVSALKIDQSFIQGMLSNSHDHAIVQAIITMGHEMGLQVIAEGVETIEHSQLLAASRCDILQGYFYGRPMPAGQISNLLAARH